MEVDEFLRNLWKVHLSVKEEGYAQDLSLGLFRSDYMLHASDDGEPSSLKQVEFNTISSSFGGLAALVSSLHTHLATFPTPSTHLAYPPHEVFMQTPKDRGLSKSGFADPPPEADVNLPPTNDAIQVLVDGFSRAHQAYGISKSQPQLPLCILFLVQEDERNLFDQLALSSRSKFPVFRLPAKDILVHTFIDAQDPSRPLVYSPPSSTTRARFEVTTIYFRALYSPAEYTSQEFWAARLHLERSAAIKCPSVLTQLAGSKKIQQILTSQSPVDHLCHFLPDVDNDTIASLRSTFAPQYDLSPDSPGLSIALDPERASNHVLKPQREGGGNNIYRTAIPPFLKSMPSSDSYSSYILMELIRPPQNATNIVLRSDGQVISGPVISELGIFGACLWRQRPKQPHKQHDLEGQNGKANVGHDVEILHNIGGGYLVRTKNQDSDEGGVAAGFSSLDSVLLYDDDADDDGEEVEKIAGTASK